jgi:ribosomal protein L7/L12
MFGLGRTELVIIAFFLLDTIVVAGVILFVWARKNKANNAGTSVSNFNANSSNSPFHSSTHSSSAVNTALLNNDEIVNLLRQGQKIEAIKIYRERTNLGLKEAKDAVEAIERQI